MCSPPASHCPESAGAGVGLSMVVKEVIMIETSPSADLRGMLVLGTTLTHDSGGDLLRFDTNRPQFYCGSDLHALTL